MTKVFFCVIGTFLSHSIEMSVTVLGYFLFLLATLPQSRQGTWFWL